MGNLGGGGYGMVEFFGGRRKALGLTHSTDEAKKGHQFQFGNSWGTRSSGFSWVKDLMYFMTTGSKITITITADGDHG